MIATGRLPPRTTRSPPSARHTTPRSRRSAERWGRALESHEREIVALQAAQATDLQAVRTQRDAEVASIRGAMARALETRDREIVALQVARATDLQAVRSLRDAEVASIIAAMGRRRRLSGQSRRIGVCRRRGKPTTWVARQLSTAEGRLKALSRDLQGARSEALRLGHAKRNLQSGIQDLAERLALSSRGRDLLVRQAAALQTQVDDLGQRAGALGRCERFPGAQPHDGATGSCPRHRGSPPGRRGTP